MLRRPSRSTELKRRQATAVVLLGVIGSEFGQDAVGETSKQNPGDVHKKIPIKTPVDGFGLGPNQNLARLTSNYRSKKLFCSGHIEGYISWYKI